MIMQDEARDEGVALLRFQRRELARLSDRIRH